MKKALCWLAAFCLLNLGAQWLARAPDGLVHMRYDSQGPTLEQAQKLQGCVAWSQKMGIFARNEGLNANITLDALYMEGPLYLLSGLELVSGLMPVFDTESLCALDERAALKLFGSTDIIGSLVEVENQKFTIACVFRIKGAAFFDTASPLIICPAQGDTRFQALDFKQPQEQAQRQLNQAGIPSPDRTLDSGEAIGFLASLPVLLAILMLLLKLPTPWKGPGLALAALLMLTGAITLQGPPVDWLPSRWSDMGFYPGLLKSLLEKRARSAMTAALRLDGIRQGMGSLSLMLSALSLCTFIYFKKEVSQ